MSSSKKSERVELRAISNEGLNEWLVSLPEDDWGDLYEKSIPIYWEEKEIDALLLAAGRGGKKLVHQFFASVGEEIILSSPEEAVEKFLEFLQDMRRTD